MRRVVSVIHQDGAFNIYIEASSSSATIFANALTRDQIEGWICDNYTDEQRAEMMERVERASVHGTSDEMMPSPRELIAFNTAGHDGSPMPPNEFIAKWLTLPVSDKP